MGLFTRADDLRVVVQGITGREGGFHTQIMLAYGTHIVAGVTPGKGGEWASGIQVLDSMTEAVSISGANTSVIFVPATQAADAIFESIDAGIELIVCVTEGIPVHDMLRVCARLRASNARLIGPNCSGILEPDRVSIGTFPVEAAMPGRIGVVSRSGTLSYEVVATLTAAGLGQSCVVGIGSDPIVGTTLTDVLTAFESDPETDAVVLIGEIGSMAELNAAEYIRANMTKRVVAYIAGVSAPDGLRMGHAGAVIRSPEERAEFKQAALRASGTHIAHSISQIPSLIKPGT
ncbi:MAG: succinyl-CoA synthetase subunit alpha [Chloroflexota bacterium]|nr:MAG: succinyl-CoA synthetase subunit alpha [Chloroflexota bacterium]